MGHKLIDVMSTSDKGLIGFTKIGEEVPLSAPEPGFLVHQFQMTFLNLKNQKDQKIV